MPQTVNLHRDGGAATIELNRPERMNALSAGVGSGLPATSFIA